MDKNTLKSFAVEARNELIDKIKVKARQYGIEKDSIKNSKIVSSDSIVINGRPLSKDEKLQREKLIRKIEDINEKGEDGYSSVIEEVAYTWFNRFTALRFMEVNNYMPTRVRPLSSTTPGSVEPDLIKEASNVDLKVDKQKIYEMKLNNDMEALFKYMIIAQCNSLNTILPFMFEKIGHYTELLLPDGLLNEGAFVRRLIDTNRIPESDWEAVEIIGWLYQYYNSEEKDRVIKAKNKYKKEEIPFATQLFTPDWIVRYMVQNSLGRYWVESHPEHNELKKEWEFYLENPNPEADFEEKLAPYINKDLKVEDIKCFDPACGSGHILVYMFDVLYQIYEKCGYMNREIPRLILENNLYGLDIDDRAYQLACFAVVMKGMKYNNRLLRSMEREEIKINIASIQETNNLDKLDIAYISGESSGKNYDKVKAFIEQFRDAKIYGSLIKVEEYDKEFLEKRCDYISNNPVEHVEYQASKNKQVDELLEKLIKQADIMVKVYDILVTNPPYISQKYMNSTLSDYINKEYKENKADLFSAFLEYSFGMVKKYGQMGFLTPYNWMFINAYEKIRTHIVNNKEITALVQLEFNAFPEACVQVCSYTMRNYKTGASGQYIKLSDFRGTENQPLKTLEAVKDSNVYYRYNCNMDVFKQITGNLIVYWLSDKALEHFKGIPIGHYMKTREGMTTADNDRFLREWFEVDINKIYFNSEENIKYKWWPYQKGGTYRKWYGNLDKVVNWENDGVEVKNNIDSKTGRCRSHNYNGEYALKEGITFPTISAGKFGARFSPKGFMFDAKGAMGFCENKEKLKMVLALLNTNIAQYYLTALAPTLDFKLNKIMSIPAVIDTDYKIGELVESCVNISMEDWNSVETSWDFKYNTIVFYGKKYDKIELAIDSVITNSNNIVYEIKKYEEEINKFFIQKYDLDEEITKTVDLPDITMINNPYYRYKKKQTNSVSDDDSLNCNIDNETEYSKEELERFYKIDLIKDFISYSVGCMLGRYSLDQENLVYAGGEFEASKYKTFKSDEDNIIPILSDSYFEDDIVAKFVEFVKVTFGEKTLSENLNFIAETLDKKSNETAKDTIRRYFLNDFFKDHVQTYKRRPIYWLFTSGKQKAFNCLIYMHRYDKTTLSRIRTDYLHELQDRLDTERKSLSDVIDGDYSTKEKNDAKKKLTAIDKQIDELKKYDEILHHMADMQIEMDLDDGVAVNYEKFKGLLSKI